MRERIMHSQYTTDITSSWLEMLPAIKLETKEVVHNFQNLPRKKLVTFYIGTLLNIQQWSTFLSCLYIIGRKTNDSAWNWKMEDSCAKKEQSESNSYYSIFLLREVLNELEDESFVFLVCFSQHPPQKI